MAEGRIGRAAKYLSYDLLGHTVGARGFIDGGLAQARRSKGKGIETQAVRATLGSIAGWGADVLAPATFKAVTYTQGVRRLVSVPVGFALDVATNVAAATVTGLTLPLAPLTAAPIKAAANLVENAVLDAAGAVGEKLFGLRR